MNKWNILLISEDVKIAYKWAMQVRSLYRKEDVEPIICSLEQLEEYLKQRNVALCVFSLPRLPQSDPAGELRQVSSMIRFYKIDCELLVISPDDDSQVLRAVRDCGGKFFKETEGNTESPDLMKLLVQIVAKKTGASYRDWADKAESLARVEERIANLQERVAEMLRELKGLSDCLFGGPNHVGWDRRIDQLEERFQFLSNLLDQQQAEQTKDLAVFKNQIGILVLRSLTRTFAFRAWDWVVENPFKVISFAAAIAGLILALFNL